MIGSSDSSPTVLVAESHEDTRALLKFWLEMKGCRVMQAVNGSEAVSLTLRHSPDLVLMGLQLPLLDGLSAIRLIREHNKENSVPIVALSTYPTAAMRESALAAGCTWFVAEPIDFDGLDELLKRLPPQTLTSCALP